MTFGINAQTLVGQRLGVGRYIEYLLKNWTTMLHPSERMSLYLRAPSSVEGLQIPAACTVQLIEPRLTGALWEQYLLPKCARDLDVLFGPSYTLPLAYRGRRVVAIHSANETQPGTHPWWHCAYRLMYELSARQADMVIVPSESTKLDLQRHYHISPDKIEVVPQGADDSFRPLFDDAIIRATRTRLLGSDCPYVLFVGKMSQRRNIPTLIEAFAKVKHRAKLPHHLVLFGPNHLHLPLERIKQNYGVTDYVTQTDGKVADHHELVSVYNAADVFVHPSSYEGWSMTTMEALACGTAVIASNRGGLGEVASGHALMVEEPSVDTLADAIEQVLTNTTLRHELREKARHRGSSFRWEDTSRMTLNVIRRVAEK